MEILEVSKAGVERRQQLINEMFSVLSLEVDINPISTKEGVGDLLKQAKEIYYPRIEASDVADIIYSSAEKIDEDENHLEGEVEITSASIYDFINKLIPKEKKLELSRTLINSFNRPRVFSNDTIIVLDEKTCLVISRKEYYISRTYSLDINLYKGIKPLKFKVKKESNSSEKYSVTIKGGNLEKNPIFQTNNGTEQYQDKELASIIKPISVEELKKLVRKIEVEYRLPAITRERQARN